MTEEDEEFQRIEREAAMRKEAVKEPMTKDETLKLALEALEKCTTWHLTREQFDKNITAIKVIKLALAAPVREPVAWIDAEKRTFEWNGPVLWNTPTVAVLDKIPLYTTPPAAQRTERNFCERCGKRLSKGFHIHTCTPPENDA
jgi:hypothetical protein